MDRGRKRKAELLDNGESTPKRQKGSTESVGSVTQLGLKLVEQMRSAKDKTGRSISDLFLELPDADEVPDYYDVIKLPIAISTVEEKLENHEYANLTQVESDFKRMVSNAKQYNDDQSEVFADAERVRKLLHNWMKIHNPAYKDPEYAPFPTPIPGEKSRRSTNGAASSEPPDADGEEGESMGKTRKPTITLSKGRRKSEAAAAAASPQPVTKQKDSQAKNGSNEFEGKSFGQVQTSIIEEFIQWQDEE